jgi:hypothetical protein
MAILEASFSASIRDALEASDRVLGDFDAYNMPREEFTRRPH